jgi:hypothetical protein
MSGRAGRTHWRGFAVGDDRLWYRPPSDRSRRPGLRFEPDALVVVDPDPMVEFRLPWDDGERPDEHLVRPAWSIHAIPRGRGSWAAFRVTIGAGTGARQIRLRSGTRPPSDELPALCRYLVTTAEARPGLADPRRTRGLLTRLAQGHWRRPEPPHEPLAGERLDLHLTVEATLDDLGWRRIDQRPVFGERRPTVDAVGPAVRAALPDELALKASDERIRDEVERHLAVGPWPFDALL